jgi:sulfoxide reductase heme-binding subunit YedZ
MTGLVAPLLFAAALGPAVYLVVLMLTGGLGINPAETLQLETGLWALRFLILTLAVTPLRRLTGWNRVIQYRRMLGLFAFFYATLHFLTYVVLDQSFALGPILEDVGKRPFITFGFLAFVVMIPLAVTSTKGWIRRLGRRWQLLHRLIYVSAAAGAIHYLWKGKVIVGSPIVYGVVIAALLVFRVIWARRKPLPRPGRAIKESVA